MNRDPLLLRDMIRACEKVARYTIDGEEVFRQDELIQDAVIRNIEIIGEASKGLSAEIKAAAPGEPWRQIGGMRDKLIHQYFGVDLRLVWSTASSVLPEFRSTLERLLQISEQSSQPILEP